MSNERQLWGDKPYYSLDFYLKETFGQKLYKLSLNGGMTCPNRDGTLGSRGCLFCSAGGSGEFTPSTKLPIEEQIQEAKKRVSSKMRGSKGKYIAYFQAYSNTYAPVSDLRKLFSPIIMRDDIAVLSIATRPDCLSGECIQYLEELRRIKPVWVELGFQTCHEATADRIRRGYRTACYDQAVMELRKHDIDVITHLILGLPGESREQMLASVDYVSVKDIQGVKLHMLHVLKGTDLEKCYLNHELNEFTLEEYADLVTEAVARLPQNVVVHRLTGDGARELLLSPLWSADKKRVLNTIMRTFREKERYQGSLRKENS